MTSLPAAISPWLCVAIATRPFRYILLPPLFCCAFLLGTLSASYASSPDSWAEFRQNVTYQMDSVLMEQTVDYQLDIDPYGTESYGVAVATGTSSEDGDQVLVVGIYDKQLGTLETSKFPLADLDLSRNW